MITHFSISKPPTTVKCILLVDRVKAIKQLSTIFTVNKYDRFFKNYS
jgi:hypothetical protein